MRAEVSWVEATSWEADLWVVTMQPLVLLSCGKVMLEEQIRSEELECWEEEEGDRMPWKEVSEVCPVSPKEEEQCNPSRTEE